MSDIGPTDSMRFSIDTAQSGPVINKNVYGQFVEHLAWLLFDGASALDRFTRLSLELICSKAEKNEEKL